MEPTVTGELKICLNGHASLTKMAAMPIDIKKHLNMIFFRTKNVLKLSLGIEHCGWESYQLYSNSNPTVTFKLFYGTVKFASIYIYIYIYV